MGNSGTADFLKVLLGDESVPVGAQPLLVEIRIHQLGVGVLVHNLVQVVPNVHLGKIYRYMGKGWKGTSSKSFGVIHGSRRSQPPAFTPRILPSWQSRPVAGLRRRRERIGRMVDQCMLVSRI